MEPLNGREPTKQNDDELWTRLEDLEQQVAAIEQRLDAHATDSSTVFADSDLLHKVIHACMAFEQIAKDEELQIIKQLVE